MLRQKFKRQIIYKEIVIDAKYSKYRKSLKVAEVMNRLLSTWWCSKRQSNVFMLIGFSSSFLGVVGKGIGSYALYLLS